jgi:hypothetical protein
MYYKKLKKDEQMWKTGLYYLQQASGGYGNIYLQNMFNVLPKKFPLPDDAQRVIFGQQK